LSSKLIELDSARAGVTARKISGWRRIAPVGAREAQAAVVRWPPRHLTTHQGREAAAQLQKMLDHPELVWNTLIGPLAHLGLARAYALSGDTTRARNAYQDFLALWKDTDPDIPVLEASQGDEVREAAVDWLGLDRC
jgi:hypothetical protein